jgi:Fe-S cluster assembly iron-binding protein IscA
MAEAITLTETAAETDLSVGQVALTAEAAVKVRELLDSEGREDLRLRIAVQPVDVPACSTSSTSTTVCSTATCSSSRPTSHSWWTG